MRVFFLGAGSSKAMGLPLTAELLPRMVESARVGHLFAGLPNGPDKRRNLLDMITVFVPGLASGARLPSIVDLLSLIDYALAEGFTVHPKGGASMLRQSRALLEAGLLDVLAQCQPSITGLKGLRALTGPGTCVITTNYDFLPDLAIRNAPMASDSLESRVRLSTDLLPRLQERLAFFNSVDYGMPWRNPLTGSVHQRPSQPSFRLFKLHGSVNWLSCPFCEHIYINPYADIALLDTDADTNQFGEATTCHCGYAPLRRVIVSPSLSRGSYQTLLRSIHLAALEALRVATEVYIVGYSLPAEDLMVRSIFLRGISYQPRKSKLQVFQVSEEARPRYDMHFTDYDYFTSGFDGFLSRVADERSE